MTWWQALILGIVEGLTEYLPVSSTGHLLLAQRALGIPRDGAANAFAICVQAGAILAVLGLYWRRVVGMMRGVAAWLRVQLAGRGAGAEDAGLSGGMAGLTADEWAGARLAAAIVVAFVPAAVLGKLLDDAIERRLFSLWATVLAWLVGGVVILIVARRGMMDRGAARLESAGGDSARADERAGRTGVGDELVGLTWRGALVIGLMQCLAMWPGTSRSLMTILGGLLVGLSVSAAVEFSFLLGVVTLLAATAYKAREAGPEMLTAYGWVPLGVGAVAAWLSAVVAVRWMVEYLRRYSLAVFGWYRVVLAIVVGVLLASGWLLDEPPVAVFAP